MMWERDREHGGVNRNVSVRVNDVTRLQALVDKKKVIITEATIRDALRLDDAESIDCLPNEEIFTELLRMGYEKPSTKLTFYKAFFLSQWKFLIHTILQCAADVVLTAVDEPSIPSPPPTTPPPPPSQNVPSTSQVQPTSPPSPIAQPPSPQQQPHSSQDAEISMDLLHTLMETCTTLTRRVEHLEQDKIAQALEITKLKQRVKKLVSRNKLKVSKLRRLKKVGTIQRVDTSDDTIIDDVSKLGRIIASTDADVDVTLKDVADIAKEVATDAEIEESDDEVEPAELQEVVKVVTTAKLMTEVVTTASVTITAADTLIPTATITAATPTLTTAPSVARRRKGVVIRDPEETATPSIIIHSKAKSKDKVQRKEKEDNAVIRYQALKRKPQTEVQAKKNMMIYLRNMAGFKMDYFEGMKYDDIHDVYTEATPLAREVPVVDYEIYTENNKPYYKIIRADGSPQLFLSFLSLLKNFDREDLEVLWQLVKESSSMEESKNSSWFSKGQELEIVRVLWSAHYHIFFYTDDLAGREKISTYKFYFGSNAQQR
nr:hypothetical protein [Tanacetum cinerariifolium]